jgi:hypothetical protein
VVGVRTVQAYRFALDLSPDQERSVVMFAGAGRFAHNVMLARVKAVMDQRAAERSYEIAEMGESTTAGSGPVAGRGANRKTPNLGQEAEKRQPGTTPVDQTGSVLPHGRTAP